MPTGGETHFLVRCSATAECGSALSCLCGVCTLACNASSECVGLSVAKCSTIPPSSACGDAAALLVCDVRCATDADCAALSTGHRCSNGVCRRGDAPDAGTGGSGGSADSGTDAATGGGAGASSCASGDLGGNEVLVIGDSFLGATHQVTAYLEDRARNSGALSMGERYRDNSGVTANALSLGGHGIAAQYASAAAESPVKVVIMDGGGTDLLVGACDTPSADCQVLHDASAAAADLFGQMGRDGVQNVVYVFYPDYEDAAIHDKMDSLRPLIQAACAASPVPCLFVDLRPTFAGHLAEYTDASNILPSALGAEAAADAIWSTMQDACVAQ